MEVPGGLGRPTSRSQNDNPRFSSLPASVERPGSARRLRFAEVHKYAEAPQYERPKWSRPHGKIGIFSLLRGKSKESLKPDTNNERGRMGRASLMPETKSHRLSSLPAARALRPGTPPAMETKQTSFDDRGDHSHLSSSLSASRAHRASRIDQDPLSLSAACSQAVRYGPLATPVGSTEVLLRNHRLRESSNKNDLEVPEEDEKKRPGSPLPPEAFTTKIYVLTASGSLMQYTGDGSADRRPEKVMQLSSASAAFACDAVPGKHWVLHVSETFSEDAPVMSARMSRFAMSKFGLGTRKGYENFLLVMESPEEMDSWLSAIRREIQGLGGIDHSGAPPHTASVEDEVEQFFRPPQDNISSIPRAGDERAAPRNANLVALQDEGRSTRADLTEESMAQQGLMLRVDSDSDREDGEQSACEPRTGSGNSDCPNVSRQQTGPRIDTTPHQKMTALASANDGQIGDHCHSGQIHTDPDHSLLTAPPPPSSCTPKPLITVNTGRRRSTSLQSVQRIGAGSRDRTPDAPVPRSHSPSHPLACSSDNSPNRRKSVTGLRRKPAPVPAVPTPAVPAPQATQLPPPPPPAQLDMHNPIPHLPATRFGGEKSVVAEPARKPPPPPPPPSFNESPSLALNPTLSAQPLSAAFRRLSPGIEHGPVVLTPPESPEAAGHTVERPAESDPPPQPSSAPPPAKTANISAMNLKVDTQTEARGKSDINDIFSPNTADILSPLSAVSDPSDVRISAHLPSAKIVSPAQSVAIIPPLSIGRPVQVEVHKASTAASGRSRGFSLGLVGSLKKDPNASGATGPNAESVDRPNNGAVAATSTGAQRHVAEERSKAFDLGKVTGHKDFSANQDARPPPRQSSLMNMHGAMHHNVNTSATSSASGSGRSTPSTGPRKESSMVPKPVQLRQKLNALETTRAFPAVNPLLMQPSPHPAPTGALPPLPPGARRTRSPYNPQAKSGSERARAPSGGPPARRANLASIALAAAEPADRPSSRRRGSETRPAARDANGADIVESTRSRRPKVERVTLAPMSDVAGMAERRRNRSPSPCNNEHRNRSTSPQVPTDSNKACSRETSPKKSLDKVIAAATATNEADLSDMEQIEEDLKQIDSAKSTKSDKKATESHASTKPAAMEELKSHPLKSPTMVQTYDSEHEEDNSSDDIPIGLGLSPRALPPPPSSGSPKPIVGLPSGPRDANAMAASAAATAPATVFPKRTSSVSYSKPVQPMRPERPRLLRGHTDSSLAGNTMLVSTTEEDEPPEQLVPPHNPLASNPITTPDLRAVNNSLAPPMRKPPPPPSSASPASSVVGSPPAGSPATPAPPAPPPAPKNNPSPKVPISKFSPHNTKTMKTRERSRSSPRLNGHERQGARQERIELPGCEPGIIVPTPGIVAAIAAPEMTPPPRMQASVTDFNQDEFYMWSQPTFNGDVKTPTTAVYPRSHDLPARHDLPRPASIATPDVHKTAFDFGPSSGVDAADRQALDQMISPKTRVPADEGQHRHDDSEAVDNEGENNDEEDDEDEAGDFQVAKQLSPFRPINLPGLQLSFDREGNNVLAATGNGNGSINDTDIEASAFHFASGSGGAAGAGADVPSEGGRVGGGSRWSLFGAIEGIH